MPLMQTKDAPTFRKAAETFQARAKALPQRYFVSPEIFAQEQSEIFSRNWLLVGHKGQLKKSGDFFVIEVPAPPSQGYGATKESLIVVRDQKSEIRAFYNVCRHRGTRLKEDTCGHTSAIQCPYHAWTYGLDGRLIGAPHMDEVRGFDRNDYSLYPVKVGIWEGFIFVNLAHNAKPLEEWFAPLHGKFSHWNLAMLRSAKRNLLICDWLFHPDAFEVRGGQPEFNPDDAIEFWDVTNKQDWHVCELSQQGIASRAYEPGPYSSRESIPAAWDREYLRRMK